MNHEHDNLSEYADPKLYDAETAYRRWIDSTGRENTRVAPLSLRYVFPQEMEALLHYNGFEIKTQYGDFDLSAVTEDSKQIVYVCKQRA